MNLPGGNHLDRQLLLTPQDYLITEAGFGRPGWFKVIVPPGGNTASARVAIVQHRLVVAWSTTETGRRSGTQVAGRFAFSKQVWSRVCLGERWAGGVVSAALVDAIWLHNGHLSGGSVNR